MKANAATTHQLYDAIFHPKHTTLHLPNAPMAMLSVPVASASDGKGRNRMRRYGVRLCHCRVSSEPLSVPIIVALGSWTASTSPQHTYPDGPSQYFYLPRHLLMATARMRGQVLWDVRNYAVVSHHIYLPVTIILGGGKCS